MAPEHHDEGQPDPWAPFQIPDELLEKAVAKWLEEGLTEDEITARLEQAVDQALRESWDAATDRLSRELARRRPRMLREHRRHRRSFERSLLRRWGKALDLFYVVYVAAEECGGRFNTQHRPAAAADSDYRFDALCQLHARACATASAVHALLRTGHAPDAHARWRTLHELAVVAVILGANAPDLSERYLLHVYVSNWLDAEAYQKHHKRLGYEPLPDDELAEIKSQRDEVVTRFGSAFGRPWGWAATIVPPGRPLTFETLEELAEVDHLRPFYKWACHESHAGAKGASLNSTNYHGTMTMRSGPTNAGLADPGHGSLISLQLITTILLLRGRGDATQDLLTIPTLRALEQMVDEAGDAFLAAHRQLERDEEEIITAMARGDPIPRHLRERWPRLRQWLS